MHALSEFLQMHGLALRGLDPLATCPFVSCCRRLLASLLTSLLDCGGRATWLLLLISEAAAVVLRPPQVTLS